MRPVKTQNEQHLVRIAMDILKKFPDICCIVPSVGDYLFFDALKGHSHLWKQITDYVSGISDGNLGVMIGLKLYREGYEKTHYLQTVPVTQLVDTSIYPEGHDQMVMLARPVVIAAMYDILATMYVLDVGKGMSGGKHNPIWSYAPKPAMRNYVKENRPRSH